MRIVAIHGQLGMASDWEGLASRLAGSSHELAAVDLWSYLEEGELGLREFGEQLNEDNADGQVLLGYSMGGRLALHALIDQPQKWKAAVIISTHAGLATEDRALRRGVDDDWSNKAADLDLPWAEFLSEWNKQGVLGDDVMPDKVARLALESRRTEISRSFKCWSLAEQEDLLESLRCVSENAGIPILWVVGEKDEKFCKEGERVVSNLENVKMLKISNAGHRIPWEAAEDLKDGIIQWVSGH